MESLQEKKKYVKEDSKATIPISARIEPELEAAWKKSNMSIRALLWRGIKAEQGDDHHVKVLDEFRNDLQNVKITQKYLYTQVDLLLRERADRLRHKKNQE